MNNDSELLELAAKAAGIENNQWSNCNTGGFVAIGDQYLDIWGDERINRTFWNPLTYDGDALRLAVKLSLTVYQWADEVCACNEKGTVNEVVARIGDHYAATRRAIVLAAAEIGRTM